MADELLLERRGRVLVMTLNRPEAKNAVNTPLADAMVAATQQLDEDDDLTIGVLTGADGGFSSGMDLKAFAEGGPPANFGTFIRNGAKKPLIAAIEGFALAGGLEIALTCDLLVAAKGVKLGIPEVKRGLFAAGGGLFRLLSRVPYGTAMELALTGDPISSEEAKDIGLVNHLAEPGKSLEVAIELAERIAENAPLSVAASKEIVRDSVGRSDAESWKAQDKHMGKVFGSEDAKEGAIAFAQKRKPEWKGR
ncbi:MAG: crotonase/enoyl-CoA hydratase family protein [Myxococcota bacterium]